MYTELLDYGRIQCGRYIITSHMIKQWKERFEKPLDDETIAKTAAFELNKSEELFQENSGHTLRQYKDHVFVTINNKVLTVMLSHEAHQRKKTTYWENYSAQN